MLSNSDVIAFLVIFALIVFFLCMWASRAANSFLRRETKYLVFSTSLIGTFVFFLSFFALPFILRFLVWWLHGPRAYVSMDFMVYSVFILPAVPAVFCMIVWQILIHRRRGRISANE